jgi:hypothetical protein
VRHRVGAASSERSRSRVGASASSGPRQDGSGQRIRRRLAAMARFAAKRPLMTGLVVLAVILLAGLFFVSPSAWMRVFGI